MSQQTRRHLPSARRAGQRIALTLLVLVSLLAASLHVHAPTVARADGPASYAVATDAAADGSVCLLCVFLGGGLLLAAAASLCAPSRCGFARWARVAVTPFAFAHDTDARGPPTLLLA